eukprot:7594-Heterococcus_DN1.PRE.1
MHYAWINMILTRALRAAAQTAMMCLITAQLRHRVDNYSNFSPCGNLTTCCSHTILAVQHCKVSTASEIDNFTQSLISSCRSIRHVEDTAQLGTSAKPHSV